MNDAPIVPTWTRTQHGAIAVLTFARPPKNWMSLASMTELADLLDVVAADEETTVVMLTGGVDGYFIAHADLDDLAIMAKGQRPPGDPHAWKRALGTLETMRQASVAAIDGQAWGGGCELSLACTMRIGSQRTHMSQPEVSVGIIPGAGGTQRLPRVVGMAKGAELCMSGRRVFAEEAKAIGLLNDVLTDESVADAGGFEAAALDWCERIARWPQAAVFAAKRAVVEGLQLPLDEGLRLEGELFRDLNSSDEARARNAAIAR